MPRFSIVIPCYNSAAYLGATLASCLGQTAADLEVIVVDDGSTDHVAEVVAQFAGDGRVRLIRQANAGVGTARNVGLEAACGDFVNFLDADDLLEPDKLERQGEVLLENPTIGLVLCDGIVIDKAGRETGRTIVDPRRFEGPAPLFDVLFSGGQYPPLVPLVRRAVALRAGGFVTDRALAGWTDTLFWMNVALISPSYHLLSERLCRYRVHQGNMSADPQRMEMAAEGIYASLFRTKPDQAIGAFRRQQARLGDLESAVTQLQGALHGSVSALEATLAHERLERESMRAEWNRAMLQLRQDHTEAQLRQAIAACRRSKRSLAVWGAGSGGRLASAIVSGLGGRVDACIDSDRSKAGMPFDDRDDRVCVMTPFDFCRSPLRDAFVLVVSMHGVEIERQLQEMSLSPFGDYLILDVESSALLKERLQ